MQITGLQSDRASTQGIYDKDLTEFDAAVLTAEIVRQDRKRVILKSTWGVCKAACFACLLFLYFLVHVTVLEGTDTVQHDVFEPN